MPATSVAADHSEDYEQLAGLQALRVLEGDELARFEAHAARCERCRVIVRLDRETVSELSLAAPEMEASPGFKERLMQRAAAELAAGGGEPLTASEPASQPVHQSADQAEPTPIRPPPNVVPFRSRRAPVWLTSLAAVLVLALGGYWYMNQVVATYQLTGNVQGSAAVLVRRSGAIELELRGLADPPPGQVYEAWIIPPGEQPQPAGTHASGQGTLPLADEARGSTVAITLELAPGVAAPTSTPLLAGAVAS